MKLVLGIDAAWGKTQPSAVALVGKDDQGWRLFGLGSSVNGFHSLPLRGLRWSDDRQVSKVEAAELLYSSEALLQHHHLDGASCDWLVAVDMPLAKHAITGSRQADRALSRAFSSRGCSVYMPTMEMPGEVGAEIQQGFTREGFHLLAAGSSLISEERGRYLAEVYPHPAVMSLLDESYRVPYKCGKSKQYWPSLNVRQRQLKLLELYQRILEELRGAIDGIPDFLPRPEAETSLAGLKCYEDALDALICCWIGINMWEGKAEAYGDEMAAIWVPKSNKAGGDQ